MAFNDLRWLNRTRYSVINNKMINFKMHTPYCIWIKWKWRRRNAVQLRVTAAGMNGRLAYGPRADSRVSVCPRLDLYISFGSAIAAWTLFIFIIHGARHIDVGNLCGVRFWSHLQMGLELVKFVDSEWMQWIESDRIDWRMAIASHKRFDIDR